MWFVNNGVQTRAKYDWFKLEKYKLVKLVNFTENELWYWTWEARLKGITLVCTFQHFYSSKWRYKSRLTNTECKFFNLFLPSKDSASSYQIKKPNKVHVWP